LEAVAPPAQRPAGSQMAVSAAEKRGSERLTEPFINTDIRNKYQHPSQAKEH